jgi:hypothetical protein
MARRALGCRRCRSGRKWPEFKGDQITPGIGPGAGLLDGALFFIARATTPEVVLLLEARHTGSSRPAWQYALARMRSGELSADLGGRPVWKQPPVKPKPEEAYWYIQGQPYRPQKP